MSKRYGNKAHMWHCFRWGKYDLVLILYMYCIASNNGWILVNKYVDVLVNVFSSLLRSAGLLGGPVAFRKFMDNSKKRTMEWKKGLYFQKEFQATWPNLTDSSIYFPVVCRTPDTSSSTRTPVSDTATSGGWRASGRSWRSQACRWWRSSGSGTG